MRYNFFLLAHRCLKLGIQVKNEREPFVKNQKVCNKITETKYVFSTRANRLLVQCLSCIDAICVGEDLEM